LEFPLAGSTSILKKASDLVQSVPFQYKLPIYNFAGINRSFIGLSPSLGSTSILSKGNIHLRFMGTPEKQ